MDNRKGHFATQSGPGTKVTSIPAKVHKPASMAPTANRTSGSSQGHKRGKQG
jgi:hypothetical protein